MRLIIADTGPVNYLILIQHIDVLPALFDKVAIPAAVHSELTSFKAPRPVKHWSTSLPPWVEVRETPLDQIEDESLKGIDAGEKSAIQLAASLNADMLLMDDRRGVRAAQRKGLNVTGTLGILDLAAQQGMVNFTQAVDRLRQTNFRIAKELLDVLLEKHKQKTGNP